MRYLLMISKQHEARLASAFKKDLAMVKPWGLVLATVSGFVMTLVSLACSKCVRLAERAANRPRSSPCPNSVSRPQSGGGLFLCFHDLIVASQVSEEFDLHDEEKGLHPIK